MAEAVAVTSLVDDTFLPFVAVVAQSMAASAPQGRRVDYHIFHSGTDRAAADKLAAFRPGSVRIIVHALDNPLARFGVVSKMPPSALMRLMLPKMLPDVPRVIYLDADLIVVADIAELANIDLGGKPIGAVTDILAVISARANNPFRFPGVGCTMRELLGDTLGLSPDNYRKYMNSGVMVLDLDVLRQTKSFERVIACLEDRNGEFPLRDQDAINATMSDEIAPIPAGWNLTCHILKLKRLDGADAGDIALLREQLAQPRVIHFAGPLKPWLRSRNMPFGGLWWHYATQTPLVDRIEKIYVEALRARGSRPNPLRRVQAATAALSRSLGTIGPLRHRGVDSWRA